MKQPDETKSAEAAANNLRSQAGATSIEYGLIAAFVALSIIVGTMISGNGLGDVFFAMAGQIHESLPTEP